LLAEEQKCRKGVVCCSELEECLLVMPFSDVTDFLKLLDIWIQVGMELRHDRD